MNSKRLVTIFDIDNCLSDDEHRIPLIRWDLPIDAGRYDKYHASAMQDTARPLGEVQALCVGEAVFFTARPNKYRDITLNWLRGMYGEHIDIKPANIYMRADNDHRPSTLLKRDMLASLLNPNHAPGEIKIVVEMAYDDRADVVAMYRENGVEARVLALHNTSAYAPPKAKLHHGSAAVPGFAEIPVPEFLRARKDPSPAPMPITMADDPGTAADVLSSMAETYRERNAVYGSNFRMVGPMMKVLFPDGVKPDVLHSDQFHLFELILVKLSRFAISGLTHEDSIRDTGVYAAMIDSILLNQQEGK